MICHPIELLISFPLIKMAFQGHRTYIYPKEKSYAPEMYEQIY